MLPLFMAPIDVALKLLSIAVAVILALAVEAVEAILFVVLEFPAPLN